MSHRRTKPRQRPVQDTRHQRLAGQDITHVLSKDAGHIAKAVYKDGNDTWLSELENKFVWAFKTFAMFEFPAGRERRKFFTQNERDKFREDFEPMGPPTFFRTPEATGGVPCNR
jgi:hypothetical protein